MKLISLNCSGESLEKAIVLFLTAYNSNSNRDFYNQFENIYIFYCENLPKKNKKYLGMSGTISSYLHFINTNFLFTSEQKDILYSSEKLLLKAYEHRHISERVFDKLLTDEGRRNSVMNNMPISYVFDNYYPFLIRLFGTMKIRFIHLSFLDILNTYITSSYYLDGHSKLYGLQSDGVVSTFDIGNMGKERKKCLEDRISRSISISPNVYAFLTAINLWMKEQSESFLVGYRPMKHFTRASYNLAIMDLMKDNSMVIEPKNTVFSAMLDSLSDSLSVEERSNIGVIEGFNRFTEKKEGFYPVGGKHN